MNKEEIEAIRIKRQTILFDKEIYGTDSKNFKIDEILLNLIDKLQKENEHLKDIKNKTIEYIEENSFEDTTGVTLNLSDKSYWEILKLLKGDN